jgi:hypothetical protein
MGWATVKISAKGRDLTMDFAGGEDAANTRWAEEKAKMAEYDRLSYEASQAHVEEKYPRGAYKKSIQYELDRANKLGLKVKVVPPSIIHDYAGMNPEAAKDFGYPIPSDEIQIAEGMTEKDNFETIQHELDEYETMKKGSPYWKAHLKALDTQDDIPKNEPLQRTYLGRKLRPANLGITV